MTGPVATFTPLRSSNHMGDAPADVPRGALLTCGHEAAGGPATSNPERWWCRCCRSFRSRSKLLR